MSQTTISRKQVKETARMASLAMNDAELVEYTTNMGNLLELIDQITSIDTDNVEPMAHPLDLNQILHDDVVSEEKREQVSEKFSQIAPAFDAGYFLVPQVIDGADEGGN